MNARQVCMSILYSYEQKPRPLGRIFETDKGFLGLDHRDRRLVFEIVMGVMRRRMTLDHLIYHFLDPDRPLKAPQLLWILRVGSYQILYLDRIPNHAAVNESVLAAKADPRTRYGAGLVNAVLRKIINCRGKLPLPDSSDLPNRLAVEFSHPRWLVERWLRRFGLAKAKKLLDHNNQRPPVHLRRRVRGLSRQQFEIDSGELFGPATGFMNLYYPLQKQIQFERIGLLRDGWCTVQSPSSGWVVAMMEIAAGDHVFDMCSAPGGKTTLISDLAGADGAVCAADVNFARMHDLQDNIHRMRMSNVFCVVADGRMPTAAGTFDKVLLDAPCTATGVLRRHPESRWLREESDLARQSSLQSELLRGAASLVGANGLIVYATCSLEHEENEAVIESFLKQNPDFSLEKPPRVVPRNFVSLDGYLQILPHEHDLDGMFAARLRRRGVAG